MTTGAAGHYRLTGSLRVPIPAADAFVLFTPRGEQRWAPGWRPRFPVPGADDITPGTVFQTDGHGSSTTWVVVDRIVGRSIRYARLTPEVSAGTVTVTLDEHAGETEVSVIYDLTALSRVGAEQLDTFAARYSAFLQSWQEAIEASLHRSDH